jgi:hypothetical protein
LYRHQAINDFRQVIGGGLDNYVFRGFIEIGFLAYILK